MVVVLGAGVAFAPFGTAFQAAALFAVPINGLSMYTKLMVGVLVLFAIAVPTAAQERGQVGIMAKAQLVPKFGIVWQIADPVAVRASLYVQGRHDALVDFGDAMQLSLSLFYVSGAGSNLRTYVGIDATIDKFVDEEFVGLLVGAQFRPEPRFGIFGELGLSTNVGDTPEGLMMFNTGVGVVFYLNH